MGVDIVSRAGETLAGHRDGGRLAGWLQNATAHAHEYGTLSAVIRDRGEDPRVSAGH